MIASAGSCEPEPLSRVAPPLGEPVLQEQDWQSLAFLHWRVEPSLVAPHLPAGTRPDLFDGSAWVGLIPFRLANATAPGLRGFGPVPYVGTFPEINVRLYSVDERGRHGVVFVSLESSRLAAVVAARALFGLPYQWARMSIATSDSGTISYRSERLGAGGLGGPPGPHSRVDLRPGSLDRSDDPLAVFLTARWGLHAPARGPRVARGSSHATLRGPYAPERGVPARGPHTAPRGPRGVGGGGTRFIANEHEPWRLTDASLLFLDDELLAAAGFPTLAARAPDSVLFAPGVHTRFGRPHPA